MQPNNPITCQNSVRSCYTELIVTYCTQQASLESGSMSDHLGWSFVSLKLCGVAIVILVVFWVIISTVCLSIDPVVGTSDYLAALQIPLLKGGRGLRDGTLNSLRTVLRQGPKHSMVYINSLYEIPHRCLGLWLWLGPAGFILAGIPLGSFAFVGTRPPEAEACYPISACSSLLWGLKNALIWLCLGDLLTWQVVQPAKYTWEESQEESCQRHDVSMDIVHRGLQ